MKAVFTALLLFALPAAARDTKYLIKIIDVLSMPEAEGKLDMGVKLYFGKQQPPAGSPRGVVVVNPKTSGVGKEDVFGCKWAMLTALKELQQKARNVGGTAVIGIESFYKKQPFSSESEFECHAGAVVIGVALRGTVLKEE